MCFSQMEKWRPREIDLMSSVYSEAPRPGELWPATVREDPLHSGGPLAAEMTRPLSPDTLFTGRGLRRWGEESHWEKEAVTSAWKSWP